MLLAVLLFFVIRAIVYRVRNRERVQYEKLYGKGNYPEDILHDVGGCIQYYKTDADETYWFEVHLPKPGSEGARKLTNRCPASYIHIPHFLICTLNPYKAYLLVDQLEEFLQSTGHGAGVVYLSGAKQVRKRVNQARKTVSQEKLTSQESLQWQVPVVVSTRKLSRLPSTASCA